MGEAKQDFIFNGQAHGSVASRLLANKMDMGVLRTNDVLLYDEWKEIDRAVLMAYQQRLVGIADLQSRGLVYNLGNAMGKSVLGYQDASDIESAQMAMDGVTRGKKDRPEFEIKYLPLPITFADFSFNARELAAARDGQMPLDTTMAELAGRKVAEKIEETLFQGSGSYTFGGGTIYGLEDFTSRNTTSVSAAWTATAADPLKDVLAMKQALINDRCYGPYVLYVSTNWETALDDDLKVYGDLTIRERLMKIVGVLDVRIADKLTASRAVLVQMTSDVIRLVNGLDLTTVQWDTEGGMQTNFKVMAIQVPQLRADAAGNCGICVAS